MTDFAIEHVGIIVDDPIAMAAWYRDALGFGVGFTAAGDDRAVAFLQDGAGRVTLEFASLPGITPLARRTDHHLQLHLALASDDPDADAERLVAAGAEFIEVSPVTRPGDRLIVLHDPWGNVLQLARRAGPAIMPAE